MCPQSRCLDWMQATACRRWISLSAWCLKAVESDCRKLDTDASPRLLNWFQCLRYAGNVQISIPQVLLLQWSVPLSNFPLPDSAVTEIGYLRRIYRPCYKEVLVWLSYILDLFPGGTLITSLQLESCHISRASQTGGRPIPWCLKAMCRDHLTSVL